MLRIAPMGRFIDAVPMSFDSTGRFFGRIPVLDATLEGQLVMANNSGNAPDHANNDVARGHLRIKVGRLTVGGLEPFEIEISAERLSPLPTGQ